MTSPLPPDAHVYDTRTPQSHTIPRELIGCQGATCCRSVRHRSPSKTSAPGIFKCARRLGTQFYQIPTTHAPRFRSNEVLLNRADLDAHTEHPFRGPLQRVMASAKIFGRGRRSFDCSLKITARGSPTPKVQAARFEETSTPRP